ncbi:N-6 DNA methylase [Streptomyces sp. NPDC001984]
MSTPTADLTISASDIAQLAGVGRSTVSNWRSRHEDFPKPVAGSAASPRFDAAQVRAWLKANKKDIFGLSADRVLWSALDAWRGIAAPEEMGDIASALITWRYVSDPESPGFDSALPAELQWPRLRHAEPDDRLVQMIRQGMRIYEDTHPERGPIFAAVSERHASRLLSALEEQPWHLLKFIDILNTLQASHMGEAFEAFQDRLTNTARRGYDEHASSAVLVDLVAAAAKSVPGPVHDPATGSGRMLLAVGRNGTSRTTLTGQEINVSAWAQVTQRALVTGHDNVTVRLGDVFANDFFERGSAQVVVLDPPYSLKYHRHDVLYLDERLSYGTPPKSSMDVAWLQIALWHLGPQGRAFVYLPPGALFLAGPTGKARTEMLRRGTIEAIVSLPGGLASNTMIPLSLWVLARPGETADPDRVLLIDHSQAKDIDIDAIATALQQWREHRVVPANLIAGAFTVAQLLTEDGNLTPTRWLASTDGAPDLEKVRSQIEALHRAVNQVKSLGVLTSTSLTEGRETPRMVTVSDLEKAGSLKLFKTAERVQEKDLSDQGTPVVTGAWIRGGEDSRWVNLSVLERDPVITQPGDILVQNTGGLAARVDEEGGRVLLSPSFLLLRPLNDVFDPHYVAEFLVTDRNLRTASGSAIQRVRVQDLKVPLVQQDEQALLVARLKEIRALQAAARTVLDDAALVHDGFVEAVAAGAVRIVQTDGP